MNSAQHSGSPRPLEGVRVLITRAREQAEALASPLRELGAEVIAIPTIEILPPQSFQPLDKALKKIQSYDWLILTSVNGVIALRRRLEKLGMDAGLLRHLSIAAIGPATKDELEMMGLKVKVVPDQYVAESVVAALRSQVKNKRVLLVRAKIARDVIPAELKRAGAEVDVVEAYMTGLPASSRQKLRQALNSESKPHFITFTSTSTVKNFFALLPENTSSKELLSGIQLASIGPITSASLREAGLIPGVEAREYTVPGLVQAIVAATEKAGA
jgi:uroporphyrinogen-III synthase